MSRRFFSFFFFLDKTNRRRTTNFYEAIRETDLNPRARLPRINITFKREFRQREREKVHR